MQSTSTIGRGIKPVDDELRRAGTGSLVNAIGVQFVSPESTARLNRLVLCLAGRLLARIPRDSGIEIADLIQAGNVGLIQAARTFRGDNGAPLAGYAKFRIRGEMLDTVRRHSGRGAACGFRRSIAREGIGAGGPDVADTIPAPAENSPLGILASAQRAAILSQAIAKLPTRYRVVVRLRYSRGLSLREIGDYLHVNESRACQLHQAALSRLRKMLSTQGVTGLSQLI